MLCMCILYRPILYYFVFSILRFTNNHIIEKHIDNDFLFNLLNIFLSQDPRERDYVKIIIHHFYGRFLSPQGYIRKCLRDLLLNFIYHSHFLPGIQDILQLFGNLFFFFGNGLK